MKTSFKEYSKNSLHTLIETIGNLFIFLPYFFSVPKLLSTLFLPWKNINVSKIERGFSFNEWTTRLMFNSVSRLMGFFMRFSLVSFYFLFQVILFAGLVIFIPCYLLSLPVLYFMSTLETPEEVKKQIFITKFVQSHTLQQENIPTVQSWGEKLYQEDYQKRQWWKLSNLFAIPPLARDWAAGYTPYLDQFTEDLSTTSYQSHIKRVIGREDEIKAIEQTLSKSEEANALIVGEEGMGKHAIIDAFAKKVYEGRTTSLLAYKRVLKLNMEKILTQYQDQKQREEYLDELLKEAANAGNIIIFIEGLDRFTSVSESRVDLSIPLEKYAKTPFTQIVATTTPFFYQKYIVPNEKISHIFTKLDIYEVSKQESVQILLNTVPYFETRYEVTIPYETVMDCIDKSDFFITDLPFPEKAVQLLDSACIFATQSLKKDLITPEIVTAVLEEKTHVPVSLNAQMKTKLLNLQAALLQKIIHQETAIQEVTSAVQRAFLLLGKRKKPLASFLFLGPTGVGKTETAKALTEIFFGNEKNLIRFDMSEYQSQEDIEKLIGSIDTLNPGLLTEAVRTIPYGVLLLDELEKANKNLLNLFLTILDEGYFTDGYGNRVDCKNLIIIATSNAGADMMYSQSQQTVTSNAVIDYLVENHIFSPEFLNRFDGIIMFKALNESGAFTVAKAMVKTVQEQILSLYKVHINLSDESLNLIIQKNYDPKFGARNLERVLRKELEDKVAQLILQDKAKEGDTVYF